MATPAVHLWHQLTQKQDKTEVERAIIAAVLLLSTQSDPKNEYRSFSHLTMEECFDKLVKQYEGLSEIRDHLWPRAHQKKFRFKSEIVYAAQWLKNGDHPNDEIVQITADTQSEGKVVRYFRSPSMPGVVTNKDGIYAPYKADMFERIFESFDEVL